MTHSSPFAIRRNASGEIQITRDDRTFGVQAVACFPWSERRRFISLRDYEGNEIELVKDLADLDDASREALEAALAESGFVLEVLSIVSFREEFEILNWEVITRQGPYRFQLEKDNWPRYLEGGSLLFRDVAGNLFIVKEPNKLDEKSRKYLWAYMD